LTLLRQKGIVDRCVPLPARSATRDQLRLVHRDEYIEHIEHTAGMDEAQLLHLSGLYEDVYFCHETFELACLSVGCALEACEAVVNVGECLWMYPHKRTEPC
jgi:histone deacetylase 6